MAATTIEFDTEMTIRTIQDIFTRFQQHFNNGDSLMIDASNLLHVDTAGAQFLYLLEQTAQHSTQTLSWQQSGTPELQIQLQSLGIHIPGLFPDI